MESKINGADVVISQTGFSGEKGYEIYVRRAQENAEIVCNGVLAAGEEFGLASRCARAPQTDSGRHLILGTRPRLETSLSKLT